MTSVTDVVVVGGGQYGLAAAARCRPAASARSYWRPGRSGPDRGRATTTA